jgi:hypothetical protein
MASDLSKYLGNKLCQWLTGVDMPTAPANLYAALYNGDPKASGTEVTTTIRAAGRVAIDWDTIADDGTDNVITNATATDFGNADADATVSYVALYDAASSGNLVASKTVVGGPLSVVAGAAVKFLAGDLTFTVGS